MKLVIEDEAEILVLYTLIIEAKFSAPLEKKEIIASETVAKLLHDVEEKVAQIVNKRGFKTFKPHTTKEISPKHLEIVKNHLVKSKEFFQKEKNSDIVYKVIQNAFAPYRCDETFCEEISAFIVEYKG